MDLILNMAVAIAGDLNRWIADSKGIYLVMPETSTATPVAECRLGMMMPLKPVIEHVR